MICLYVLWCLWQKALVVLIASIILFAPVKKVHEQAPSILTGERLLAMMISPGVEILKHSVPLIQTIRYRAVQQPSSVLWRQTVQPPKDEFKILAIQPSRQFLVASTRFNPASQSRFSSRRETSSILWLILISSVMYLDISDHLSPP